MTNNKYIPTDMDINDLRSARDDVPHEDHIYPHVVQSQTRWVVYCSALMHFNK